MMAQRLVNDKGASPVLHWVSRIQRTVSRNGMNCARVLWTAVLRADAHGAGLTSPLYTHDMAWMSETTTSSRGDQHVACGHLLAVRRIEAKTGGV